MRRNYSLVARRRSSFSAAMIIRASGPLLAMASTTIRSPWLPVEADYKRYNVESEKRQPDSIFAWYSALIRLRHRSQVFQEGKYVPLEAGNPDVFVFGRSTNSNEIALALLNCSPIQQKVHITGLSGSWPHFRAVMASPASSAPMSPNFTVAGYGTMIISTESAPMSH